MLAPRWTPATIRHGVQPLAFSRFQTSIRAPRLGQEGHDAGQVLVGRPVHGGLAVVVHGVQLAAQRQRHLDGLEHLRLGAGILARGLGAHPGRHHQRRGVVLVGQQRVGAQLGQQAHQLGVRGAGREEKRRAADHVQRGDPGGRLQRDAGVEVRPLGRQHADEREAVHVARARGRRIVAAGVARLAHPRHLVQRRPPVRRHVGIGPPFQQPRRQLVVCAPGREQQGVEPLAGRPLHLHAEGRPLGVDRQRIVQARAGVEQQLGHLDAPFPRREQQRREAVPRSRADVRPVREQRRNDLRVAFRRRPHQRRLPPPRLGGVDVGAARQQQLHGLDHAGARRRQQRGLALRQHRVRIGSGVEQQLDHGGIAVDARQRQRLHAVAVGGRGPRARADQQLGDAELAAVHRPVERRAAVGLGAVRIDLRREQRPHGRLVGPLDRVDQPRVHRRAQPAAGQQRQRGGRDQPHPPLHG